MAMYYTDNLYTNINLAKQLGENNSFSRNNKKKQKEFNTGICISKVKKGVRVQQKNDHTAIVKWKDKSNVLMLTTKNGEEMKEIYVAGTKRK